MSASTASSTSHSQSIPIPFPVQYQIITNPPKANTSNPFPASDSLQINNLAASNKPADAAANTAKPKPCCVCKEEKAARDECMLFSTAKDPQAACGDLVSKYRSCMKGFGFDLA